MNHKVIKDIYLLRYNNDKTNSTRKIASVIKEKYNLNQTKEQIGRYIIKHFPQKGGKKEKLSSFQLNFLIKSFTKVTDKEKILKYFHDHFDITMSKQSMLMIMSKHKIKTKHRNFKKQRMLSDKIEREIVKKYQKGMSAELLAQQYGFKTRNSIYDILKRHDKKARSSFEVNEDRKKYKDVSFNLIDSREKAYFLGLMYTDGYIIKRQDGVYAGIQLTDKDCISYLSNYFGFPFYIIKRKNSNCQLMYRLTIHGKRIVQELEALGVLQRKSLKLSPPPHDIITTKYTKDILRGVIDGDGWVRKDGKEFFICSASKAFIKWCINALSSLGMSDLKITTKKQLHYNDMYHVRTAKRENIDILKNTIYNEPYGMMRKYDRIRKTFRDYNFGS